MPTQGERRAQTRGALVAAATLLFTERGYAATATDDIVRAAGVTRGALYHHFVDKRDLFLAVFHTLQAEIEGATRSVGSFSTSADAFEVFVAGCMLYLDTCRRDPRVVRIVLSDGPTVLGPEQWHVLDADYADASIGRSLRRLQVSGLVRADIAVAEVTMMLNGALNEAALFLARSDHDPALAMARVETTLRQLLLGIRVAAPKKRA